MPSDTHAGSRRKRLFAAYIRSACPVRQAQRKMDARCALILGLAERVYHSQQLLTLYILYSLCLLLSTLWLLYGSSGLLRKLAHPFKLRPPAGRALPVPPCERIFSTIYFGIVARHDTVVLRSFPRISPKISLSRAHKFKQYHLFFLILFFQRLNRANKINKKILCVIPLSPPQKKEPLGLLWSWFSR